MFLMLISVILDTIMMTVEFSKETGTLVITCGLRTQVFYVMLTSQIEIEELAPLCSPESDSVSYRQQPSPHSCK